MKGRGEKTKRKTIQEKCAKQKNGAPFADEKTNTLRIHFFKNVDGVELDFKGRLPAEIADLKIYGYTDNYSTKAVNRKISSLPNKSKSKSTKNILYDVWWNWENPFKHIN